LTVRKGLTEKAKIAFSTENAVLYQNDHIQRFK